MKILTRLTPLLLMLISSLAFAQPPKVDVCHYSASTGTYSLISVAAPSVPAHLAHGDALPGDPVPTNPGYEFDASCNQVLIYVSTCTCDLSASALDAAGINTTNAGICFTMDSTPPLFEDFFARDETNSPKLPIAGIFHNLGFSGACIVRTPTTVIESSSATDSESEDCKIDITLAVAALGIPDCP